jgi:hypothetical protein
MAWQLTTPWIERFWHNKRIEGDCWIWAGHIDPAGYGRTGIASWNQCEYTLSQYPHRVAWCLAHRQAIPDGLEIDHLCGRRACINPDHLEAITLAENRTRERRHKPPKPLCIHGHQRRQSAKTGIWYCPDCIRICMERHR